MPVKWIRHGLIKDPFLAVLHGCFRCTFPMVFPLPGHVFSFSSGGSKGSMMHSHSDGEIISSDRYTLGVIPHPLAV